MYSVKDASEILGVKVRTIRHWIRSGILKAEKDEKTKRWKIKADDIRRIKRKRRAENDNKNRKYSK